MKAQRPNKNFRFLIKFFAWMLLVLVVLLLSLRLPFVQNAIVDFAATKISKKLNTKVSIDKVLLNFVDNASIKGIYIEDLNQDTLIYTDHLNVELGFWKLLKGEIVIDDLSLSKGIIKVFEKPDSTYNFDFIVDYFASTDTTTQQQGDIKLDIKTIRLNDIRLQAELISSQNILSFQDLLVDLDKLDLINGSFIFNEINLDGLNISSIQNILPTSVDANATVDTSYVNFPLEAVPFEIESKQTNISNSNILYKSEGAEASTYFDPNYIELRSLNFEISNLKMDKSKLIGTVARLHLYLNDVFVLDDFNTSILFTNEQIVLDGFDVQTAESRAELALKVDYDNFNELLNNYDAVPIELNAKTLDIAFSEISYFVPEIDQIEQIRKFRKNNLKLNGQFNGTAKKLSVVDLGASISKSNLKLNGQLENLLDASKISFKKINFKAKAAYEDYAPFISDRTLRTQLKEIGNINLSTKMDGNMSKINFSQFDLNTTTLLNGRFSGEISNVTDSKKMAYQLNIEELTSGRKDALIFLDSLPEMLSHFDTITYRGVATGDLQNVALTGGFSTSLGGIETDLKIEFDESYSDAVYAGKLNLQTFDLGILLDNDSLNTISFTAEIDGKGLDLTTMETTIKANVSSFDFNSYTYEDLNINGHVTGQQFLGSAGINDPNLRFEFEGRIDLNDSIPIFAFTFDLDTINFTPLHLIDQTLGAQFKLQADLQGSEIDDLKGLAKMYNIRLQNGKESWATDSIFLFAAQEGNQRTLNLKSQLINANLHGEFQLALLPDAILDFLDQYFPMKSFLGATAAVDSILDATEIKKVSGDNIKVDVGIQNINRLAQFFEFPLTRMDSSFFRFSLDAPNNLTNMELHIPAISYDGYFADSIYMTANNDQKDAVNGLLKIDSIAVSESIHMSQVDLGFLFKEQKAKIKASIKSKESFESLGFALEVRPDSERDFLMKFVDEFILNGKIWKVTQEESTTIAQSGFIIPQIILRNQGEELGINGDSSEIFINLKSFDISNFVDIIGMDSIDVSGLINGKIQIGVEENMPIIGNVGIADILFNKFQIGNIDLNTIKDGDEVLTNLQIKGKEMDLDGKVNYGLNSNNLTGNINVEKLNLAPFNPFLTDYAKNLSGIVLGKLEIEGSIDDPVLKGEIEFKEVEAFIVDLSTNYKIKNGTLKIDNGLLVPNITLEDEKKRLSFLSGQITHDYFQNIKFNLDYNADAFTFLNSPKSSKALFYGKLVGQVSAKITGDLDLPIVDANVLALRETDLTIQLLNSEAVLVQEDYIIFYDQSKAGSLESIDSIANSSYRNTGGIDLNLKLSATDVALFHVIVDPVTGDKLDVRGNTSLVVKIPNQGDINIIGEYIVTEGNYSVSYENTIRRNFKIDPGSKLIFQGDPYAAQLDLQALYETEVNPSPLLQNAIDLAGDNAISAKEKVNVVMNVAGTLSKPDLTFDIRVPDSGSSPFGNSLTTALTSLRQDETRLLEQVFSVILFNSFTGGSSGGNLSSVGTATAISSVGNLINGQLSKLAKKASGFEIQFALDQYKGISNTNANITEFDLGISKRLFNERLIISADGNANLETGAESSNNFSSFAGDFVIQYLLTENGKYRVKVFQKSDFNALSHDNVWKTGIGLSYKTKFGQIIPKKSKNE